MYYFDIIETLFREKVKYLVVGGLAVNLHGVPRVTQDIDLVISTGKDNIMKLVNALASLGYVPRLPVDPADLADEKKVRDWMDNRNMKAFSFYHAKDSYKVVDIVLNHPLDFERAFARRAVFVARSVEVPVACIDDIIEMKRVSGRPQDISDIAMLVKAGKIMENGDV